MSRVRKGLKVYRLEIPGGEDNVDESEHFSALAKARRRRSELIRTGAAETGTLSIERLELIVSSPLALVLKILDGKGYVESRVEVVPAWRGEEKREDDDDGES